MLQAGRPGASRGPASEPPIFTTPGLGSEPQSAPTSGPSPMTLVWGSLSGCGYPQGEDCGSGFSCHRWEQESTVGHHQQRQNCSPTPRFLSFNYLQLLLSGFKTFLEDTQEHFCAAPGVVICPRSSLRQRHAEAGYASFSLASQ